MQLRKPFLFQTIILFLLLGCSPARQRESFTSDHKIDEIATFTNPIIPNGADPWVLKDDSVYYFCFADDSKGRPHITVSKSNSLTMPGKRVIIWQAPEGAWNSKNLWAPELHKMGNKWYVYYTAGKAGPPFIYQRSGVLESITSDPQGEYIEKGILQTGIDSTDYVQTTWAIDLTVAHINGRLYAIWSGWDKNETSDATPQHLFMAEMSDPYTISSRRSKISEAQEEWETGGPLNLIEGPQVVKHDGRIFIFYSTRESWTKEYRIGQLQLVDSTRSPLDKANWIKKGPVFRGTDSVFGPGHASYTTSPDGKESWILYHAKKSDKPGWARDIRLQPFTWSAAGQPEFGDPVNTGLRLKRPSGEEVILRKKNNRQKK